MTATRSRKEEMYYRGYRNSRKSSDKGCQFCAIKKTDDQFVAQTKHFIVIKNIFQYSLWDGQRVSDHLMIIPKQHTDTLGDVDPATASEYLKLLATYETKGYNIYARTPQSQVKSVVHQHTHLIKLEGKIKKFIFMIHKPYIRFVR